MQDPPDGVGGDLRQSIGRGSQGLLQKRERPCGGAVELGGRFSACLAEDAFAVIGGVSGCRPAAVSGSQGLQTLAIEAGDEMGDGIALRSGFITVMGHGSGSLT